MLYNKYFIGIIITVIIATIPINYGFHLLQVLATGILHLLGREGPRTTQPSKYIRFIYNRVILESAPVRAAAVTALAKFGAHCEGLLESVIVLVQRSVCD